MILRHTMAAQVCACALVLVACIFVAGPTRPTEARPGGEPVKDLPHLTDLPLTAVEIQDGFWSPRIEINRTKSLDHVYAQIEATGGIRNFEIAAGKAQGKFGGPFWADSDVYKWIEGASYSLALHPDPKLEARWKQYSGAK